MRRRLVIAAFVLDGLCALAAPFVLPLVGTETAQASDRYVEVAGLCIEQMRPADAPEKGIAGRPVDASFCQ